MSKENYGFAGMKPNNNGVIDNDVEIMELLKGLPEGVKLAQILERFPVMITVTDITGLTAQQLDALRASDRVNKVDITGVHSYCVSYKSDNGLCLTYTDCENVETVAYEIVEGVWTYQSTDVTHIAG